MSLDQRTRTLPDDSWDRGVREPVLPSCRCHQAYRAYAPFADADQAHPSSGCSAAALGLAFGRLVEKLRLEPPPERPRPIVP
jgi:hypothetical protein